MALTLSCPGCRDAVTADDADRGKTIKCGTCWSDVPVPPGDKPKPAPVTAKPLPPPPAKAVPTTTPTGSVPKAVPLPANGSVPKAAPLPPPAKPATATATATATALPLPKAVPAARPAEPKPKRAKDDEKEEKKKPRFKERRGRDDDDDDEDDDRPRKGEQKKGGGGVLIAFLVIGFLMLAGLGGAIAVVVMNSNPNTASASTPTTGEEKTNLNPVPNLNPRPRPQPIDPNPKPPPKERSSGWDVAKGKRFECDMPGAVSRTPASFEYAARMVSGDSLSAQEGGDAIKVTAIELNTGGGSPISAAFVAAVFGVKEADLKRDVNPRLLTNYHGFEFTGRTPDGYENAFMSVPVGPTDAILVRYQWKPGTAGAEAKRDTFLASVNILVDPNSADGRPAGDDIKVPKKISKTWVPLENKYGFEAKLPVGAKMERSVAQVNRDSQVSGVRWSVNDGEVRYYAFVHDLADGQTEADLPKIVSESLDAVQIRDKVTQEDTKVGGRPAVRWELKRHNHNSHGVSVKVGYRVFTLFVTSENFFSDLDATIADREDRFLNSLKITFDEKKDETYPNDPAWVPMAKTIGFTALVPKQATSQEDFNPLFGFDAPVGKKWTTEVDGIAYQVFVIDLTPPAKKKFPGPDKTVGEVLETFTKREPLQSGPNKEKLGTLDADGYLLNFDHNPSNMRVFTIGKVTYLAKTSRPKRWDKLCGDREFADKSAKFFASFRLGEGVAQPGGGGPGGVEPGGNAGEFAQIAAGKVQPFWSGVFLPKKKEFLTVGLKDANTMKGVVRRYSVPDFKLLGTYSLSAAGHRVAADETTGKLYIALVKAKFDAAKVKEKDPVQAVGDVVQYDLTKLLEGSTPEGEALTPTATLIAATAGLEVSALDVAPDGAAVYVAGVKVSGAGAKQTRTGRVVKWEVAAARGTDLLTDLPVWAANLTPDGKKLAVVEQSRDVARPGGNLIVIDAANWKQLRTIPLAGGSPSDAAAAGERVAAAVSGVGGAGKVVVGNTDGDTSEVNNGTEASYLRLTHDGKRLLVSAGLASSGLTLYEVSLDKTPKLTKAATSGDLGGQFVLSADGKLAVLNTGQVLDLEKSKAK